MGCCVSTDTVAVPQSFVEYDRPLSPKTQAVIARLKQAHTDGDENGDGGSPEASPPDSPRLHVKPSTHEVVFGDRKRKERDPGAYRSWTELLLQAEAQRKPLNPDLQKDLLSGMALGRLAPLHLWKKAVRGNTVRVFFAGAAEDTEKEQDIFFEDCVPFLRAISSVVGVEYEAHDLRLGCNFEDRSNHRVTPERHREIERCLRSSMGLAFVGLVGDKYGTCPLPTTIEAGLFHRMLALFGTPVQAGSVRRTSSTEIERAKLPRAEQATVESWFELDLNSTPAVYHLVPINLRVPGFDGSQGRRAQHSAEEHYRKKVEGPVARSLLDIASAGMTEGSLTKPEGEPFHRSAMAEEMAKGLIRQAELDGGHAKHGALFLRSFKGLANRLSETGAGRFMDILKTKERDDEAEELLKGLRQALARCIQPDKLVTLSLPWREGGMHPERFGEHRTYLSLFSDKCVEVQVYGICEGVRERPLVGELAAELAEHLLIAEEKAMAFAARDTLLTSVRLFLTSQGKPPTARIDSGGSLIPLENPADESDGLNGSTDAGDGSGGKRQGSRVLVLLGPEGSGKATLVATALQKHMRYADPAVQADSKPMELLSRLPSMRSLRGDAAFKSKASRPATPHLEPIPSPELLPDDDAPPEGSGEPVLVLRFVSATRFSRGPALLLHSIIQQLAAVYGPPPAAVDPLLDPAIGAPLIPESLDALAAALPLWLSLASPRRPLILAILGLHNLHRCPNLSWLPLHPPKNVTVIISASFPPPTGWPATQRDGSGVAAMLQRALGPDSVLAVDRLSPSDVAAIMQFWLAARQRTLTAEQSSVVQSAVEAAGKGRGGVTVLQLQLLLEQTRHWRSSTAGKALQGRLVGSEEGAVRAMLQAAEEGQPAGLVGLVVGGLAQARGGLSVMELVDLTNASGELVRGVLRHANPPLTRPAQAVVPAARVLRVLHELRPLIGERVVEGGRRMLQFRLPIYKRVAVQYATRTEEPGWGGMGTLAESVADMMCGIVRADVREATEADGHGLIQQLLAAISSKKKPVLFHQDGLVAAWTEKGEMLRVNERRLQEAPPLLIRLDRMRELQDMLTAPAAIWYMCRGLRRLEYGRYWRALEAKGHSKLVDACIAGIQDFAAKPGCMNQATQIALQLSDFLLFQLDEPAAAGRVAQLSLLAGSKSGIETLASCLLAHARCLLAQGRLAEALGVMREGVRAWKEVGFTLPQKLLHNMSFRKAMRADSPYRRQSQTNAGIKRQGSNLGVYAGELARMNSGHDAVPRYLPEESPRRAATADAEMEHASPGHAGAAPDAAVAPEEEGAGSGGELGEKGGGQAGAGAEGGEARLSTDATSRGTAPHGAAPAERGGDGAQEPWAEGSAGEAKKPQNVLEFHGEARLPAAGVDGSEHADASGHSVLSFGSRESPAPSQRSPPRSPMALLPLSAEHKVGSHAPSKLLEAAAGMAEVLGRLGKWEDVEEVYAKVSALAEDGVEDEEGSMNAAVLHLSLARVRRTLGRLSGALLSAEMAKLHLDKCLVDGHMARRAMLAEMVAIEAAAGAEEDGAALLASVSGEGGPWMWGVRERVAEALVALGRWGEARTAMEGVRRGYVEALGEGHVLTVGSGIGLGMVLRGEGELAGAVEVWGRTVERLRRWVEGVKGAAEKGKGDGVGGGEGPETDWVPGMTWQCLGCAVRVCVVGWEQLGRARVQEGAAGQHPQGESQRWAGEQGRGLLAGDGGALGWGMTLGYRCVPVSAGSSLGVSGERVGCLLVALLQTLMAEVHSERAEHQAAEALLTEAAEAVEKAFGMKDMEVVAARGRRAEAMMRQGRSKEALTVLEGVGETVVACSTGPSSRPFSAEPQRNSRSPNGIGRRWWEAKDEGSEFGWEAWVKGRWLERTAELQLEAELQ